ncbi:hypothetical protein EVAR_53908_1 [Eumeta japonica]|uniref:Uncharacterized protein n=1 Tax=Eumeta variegata TaxID=151549 RepID=A0A4C1YI41_EUMVA|nr:hypothetical protein EVAR_53908_1 [Eumeta japonica]
MWGARPVTLLCRWQLHVQYNNIIPSTILYSVKAERVTPFVSQQLRLVIRRLLLDVTSPLDFHDVRILDNLQRTVDCNLDQVVSPRLTVTMVATREPFGSKNVVSCSLASHYKFW